MRAYELFLEMEQLQELQESIVADMDKAVNVSERKRLEIHLDRVCADWLAVKHQLDILPAAKEIIDTIRQLKSEQIEVSDKLGKATFPIIRKRYKEQLDMMLADITNLKHQLQRL